MCLGVHGHGVMYKNFGRRSGGGVGACMRSSERAMRVAV